MIKRTVYTVTKEDMNWPQAIEEAFNRVISFAGELHYSPAGCGVPHRMKKLFNKVTCDSFTAEEWQDLHAYGLQVVSRAIMGAKNHPQEVADSIDQAALNLRDVLASFDCWFHGNK